MNHSSAVIRLEDYRPTPYAIDAIDLAFQLHPDKTRVRAILSIRPGKAFRPDAPLVLDGDGLVFRGALLDGIELKASAFVATSENFTLHLPPSSPFKLEIETELNPGANSQLMGLYRSGGAYCTQCEADGFRRITYFYDRPDVLSLYKVRIEAPKSDAPILLSNGNLIDQGDMDAPNGLGAEGEEWHFAQWEDPFPKPSYLFALVAGDLACVSDRYRTGSGRDVALHIYVEHGKEDRVDYAMDALKRSMAWDEAVFGREYDLDIFMIVAVSDFNMGAMENKGLNIFNDKYVLARPDTATDTDYALIEAIIAHEYFHNWTGNRITCRDWFQLCLKEGLTVFRDQEFSADMRSRPVKRIADVQMLKARQFPEDSGPLAHPVRPDSYTEINNFYTATVYEKGAELCRMIKTILGDDGFKAGMDLYFKRHDGEAATIEDFLSAFEDATGRSLDQFKIWYSQAGTPSLVITYACQASGQAGSQTGSKSLTLTIEQSCPPTPGQPTKKLMHIPLRFGLVGRDGQSIAWERIVDESSGETVGDGNTALLNITERQHRFRFEGVTGDAVPSLLRSFSAPVLIRSNLTLDDHLCLMHHDGDSFNRWSSAQIVFMNQLTRACRSEGEEDTDPPSHRTAAQSGDLLPQAALEAIRATILDDRLEPAFRAQILHMPTEMDIARELGKDVDPDRIHAAHSQIRQALADGLSDALMGLYDGLASEAPFAPDAAAAGRRALRNEILDLTVTSGNRDAITKAKAQYHDANNMTDRLAALSCLVHGQAEGCDALLDDFHARHASDALIVDKWFSLQASTPQDGTLERVHALMDHSSFSLSNPNRVRALIGAFAMNNMVQFNRADGAGFELVADAILALDGKNAQTAARLANNFRSWRALTEERRNKAQAQLQRIANHQGLSKDVADIVNRCLQ